MEDRFTQQLKKGVLEMLVLKLICQKPTYGYELLVQLKEQSSGRFALKINRKSLCLTRCCGFTSVFMLRFIFLSVIS